MRRSSSILAAVLGSLLLVLPSSPVAVQAGIARGGARTEDSIRRAAGLDPVSAADQIRILDVGHHPLDTMTSITANRVGARWRGSYACAFSPRCGDGVDHDARGYTLSAEDSAAVDRLLVDLRAGSAPGGVEPSPAFVGGYARVSINYMGLRREYERGTSWGETLGRLRVLLSPPRG